MNRLADEAAYFGAVQDGVESQQELIESLRQQLSDAIFRKETAIDVQESLRQQLAAALAACKVKDHAIDHMCFNTKAMETYDSKLVKEARAIQPRREGGHGRASVPGSQVRSTHGQRHSRQGLHLGDRRQAVAQHSGGLA